MSSCAQINFDCAVLYFDQSSIPLTGMQEQIDSEHNEEGYDDNRS